jgi:hypothetical protein
MATMLRYQLYLAFILLIGDFDFKTFFFSFILSIGPCVFYALLIGALDIISR